MKTRGLHIFLTACVFMCVISCHAPVNVLRNEVSFKHIKEEASLNGSGYCIVLVDDDYDIQYYKSKIIDKNEGNPCLWNFVNVDRPENYWYKWLLGTWKSPFTIIFDNDGQIENIVFGTSEYACKSIESAISSRGKGIIYKNFGFARNSDIPDCIENADEFIYNHLQLISDTACTYCEKYLKADSLAHISGYPFSSYLKLCYGRHIFSKNSIAKMACGFIDKYIGATYSKITYSSLIQRVSEDFLTENSQTLIDTKVRIAKKHYRIGDEVPITVTITNNGEDDISIEKIETTCSCIKMVPENRNYRRIIRPHETINYLFSMELESSGKVYHEIYFYTNSPAPLATAAVKVFFEQ